MNKAIKSDLDGNQQEKQGNHAERPEGTIPILDWPWSAQVFATVLLVFFIIILLVGLPAASLLITEKMSFASDGHSLRGIVSFWGALFAAFISLAVVFIGAVFAFTAIKVESGARVKAQRAAEKVVKSIKEEALEMCRVAKEECEAAKNEVLEECRAAKKKCEAMKEECKAAKEECKKECEAAKKETQGMCDTARKEIQEAYEAAKEEFEKLVTQKYLAELTEKADFYIKNGNGERTIKDVAKNYADSEGERITKDVAKNYAGSEGERITKDVAKNYVDSEGEKITKEVIEQYTRKSSVEGIHRMIDERLSSLGFRGMIGALLNRGQSDNGKR